jgi:hypothetical protein
MGLPLLGAALGMGVGMASAGERQRELRKAGGRRDRDIGFLQSQLKDRIYGTDPAMALQQRQMTNKAQAAVQSAAAGARPGQAASARRQGLQAAQNIGSGAVGQGVLADMLNRQRALQQYQGLTTQLRGQDLNLAGLQMQQPTQMEQMMGGLQGFAGLGLS